MKECNSKALSSFCCRRTVLKILFSSLFLLLFFACGERAPEERINYLELEPIKSAKYSIQGKVISVSDGDTFSFRVAKGDANLNNTKDTVITVRSHGIDAPESDQPYGAEAALFLRQQIMGRDDVVVYMTGAETYGRLVGIPYVDDKDISYESLNLGYAWHYKQYDNSVHYIEAARDAKANKLGLWKGESPLNPYQWRKMTEQKKEAYRKKYGYK